MINHPSTPTTHYDKVYMTVDYDEDRDSVVKFNVFLLKEESYYSRKPLDYYTFLFKPVHLKEIQYLMLILSTLNYQVNETSQVDSVFVSPAKGNCIESIEVDSILLKELKQQKLVQIEGEGHLTSDSDRNVSTTFVLSISLCHLPVISHLLYALYRLSYLESRGLKYLILG